MSNMQPLTRDDQIYDIAITHSDGSVRKPLMASKSFTKFPHLPHSLQRRIWRQYQKDRPSGMINMKFDMKLSITHAADRERCLEMVPESVDEIGMMFGMDVTTGGDNVLLFACRESRRVAQEEQHDFLRLGTGRKIWFSPEKDTICIDATSLIFISNAIKVSAGRLWIQSASKVRNLNVGPWESVDQSSGIPGIQYILNNIFTGVTHLNVLEDNKPGSLIATIRDKVEDLKRDDSTLTTKQSLLLMRLPTSMPYSVQTMIGCTTSNVPLKPFFDFSWLPTAVEKCNTTKLREDTASLEERDVQRLQKLRTEFNLRQMRREWRAWTVQQIPNAGDQAVNLNTEQGHETGVNFWDEFRLEHDEDSGFYDWSNDDDEDGSGFEEESDIEIE